MSLSSTSNFERFLSTFFLLTFSCGVLFIGVTEWLIRTQVIPVHHGYHYSSLFKNTSARIVAFGDSQIEGGLIDLPGVLNLGHGGDGFLIIAAKVRAYLAQHTPEKIILGAGVHHFSPVWRIAAKNDTKDVTDIIDPDKSGPFALLHPFHKSNLLRYWETWLFGRGFQKNNDYLDEGGIYNRGDYSAVDENFRRIQTKRHASYMANLPDPLANNIGEVYINLLRDLNAEGVKVCMIAAPVAELFRSYLPDPAKVNAIREFFAEISAQYSATYIDFYELSLPQSSFDDPTHLNIAGARVFSKEVSTRCQTE